MKEINLYTTDEASLVGRCKSNDPQAQQALYYAYADDMLLLCLRYVVNQEDAREVLMDAFFSFYKNIGSFSYNGEGSVKAWLKKIVVNQCLMHLRKRTTFAASAKDAADYADTSGGEEILAALAAKEILKRIQALPDEFRTVFNLFVFEGKSHKEIGALLEIPENTSKSHLHRAKTMLQKQLSQAYC